MVFFLPCIEEEASFACRAMNIKQIIQNAKIDCKMMDRLSGMI